MEGVALGTADIKALLFAVEVFVRVHKRTSMAAYLALELWAEKYLTTPKHQEIGESIPRQIEFHYFSLFNHVQSSCENSDL